MSTINKIIINNYTTIIKKLYKNNYKNINNKLQMTKLEYKNSIYSYEGRGLSKESSIIIKNLLDNYNYKSELYNIKLNNKKIYYLYVPNNNIIISPTWRELFIDKYNTNINDFHHNYVFKKLPPFYIGPLEIFQYYYILLNNNNI